MAIPTINLATPINSPNPRLPLVDAKGNMTTPTLQLLQSIVVLINGLTTTISCAATNVGNVYTLTPFNISPKFGGYLDYQGFAFVAPATSAGLVTATVVPPLGALATIKVFKTHGSAQATTNDIIINLFYVVYYVDSLDSGAGGLVIQ